MLLLCYSRKTSLACERALVIVFVFHVAGSESTQLRLHWRVTNDCVGLHGPTPDF